MERASHPETEDHLLSSIATNGGHGEHSCYFDGWKAYDEDPYHPTDNPDGVIQMGLAENQLCHDLIEEWLKKNPDASICTPEGVSQFKDIAIFQDYHGLTAFRQAFAKFMEKERGGKVKFDPDRVVMSGGATGAQELMAFCLADPGDVFLIPTPYYPGFDRDFCWRTGVKLLPFPCKSSDNFKLSISALESAYEKALRSNLNVKGILITNPSNPLGTLLDRDTLLGLLHFITSKNIHLVCDEIFAGTVFRRPDFTSVSQLLHELPASTRSLVHMVCSLSKDLGLPGFRVGVVYSFNDQVVNIARKMSSFGLVSTQTQRMLASMLSDNEFTSRFLAESSKRLADRHEKFTSGLGEVGIRCLESNAGLFCWMDLRGMLKEATVQEEAKLWRVILDDVKINVSPGSSFHCDEPGWFRVCFANMDGRTMEESLRRIRRFVFRAEEVAGAPAVVVEEEKKKRWQTGLRLSMPKKRFEDMTMMTPRVIMSPHSPLVLATKAEKAVEQFKEEEKK